MLIFFYKSSFHVIAIKNYKKMNKKLNKKEQVRGEKRFEQGRKKMEKDRHFRRY